jgi:hypothetical protein
MADREPDALEPELRRLGTSVAWPEFDVAGPVGAELRAGRRTHRPVPTLALWPRWRVIALFVIGLLLIAGTAVAAKLAIGAIAIKTVPELSSPTGSQRAAPRAVLGRRVSLEEAQNEVSFPIATPASTVLGAPDGVYVGPSPFGGERISLTWAAANGRPRLDGTAWSVLLMEFQGTDTGAAVKEVLPQTRISTVRVSGGRGFWIDGPHQLLLPNGDSLHLGGSVLLWERDGVTYRLESTLSEAAAVRLVETVT